MISSDAIFGVIGQRVVQCAEKGGRLHDVDLVCRGREFSFLHTLAADPTGGIAFLAFDPLASSCRMGFAAVGCGSPEGIEIFE